MSVAANPVALAESCGATGGRAAAWAFALAEPEAVPTRHAITVSGLYTRPAAPIAIRLRRACHTRSQAPRHTEATAAPGAHVFGFGARCAPWAGGSGGPRPALPFAWSTVGVASWSTTTLLCEP